MSQGTPPDGVALNRTDLRLVVDNLGPISHASVALKPLTVLIGRNNTGKTYLAQALYAARRAVDASHLSFVAPLSKQEFEAFSEVLERHAYQDPRTKELRKVELPPEVLTKAREWVRQALSDAGSSLDRQLGSSFGVPDVGELRRWDQQESVVVQMHQGSTDNGKGLFGTGGTPGHDPALNSTVTFDRDWDFLARSELIRGSGRDEGESLVRHFSQMLMSAVWQGYIESVGLAGSAHYLPAGRSGLLHAWTDVVRLRLELEREQYGLSRFREPALDGVALDFISSLAGLLGPHPRPRRRSMGWWSPKQRDAAAPGSLSLLRQVMDGEIYAGSGDDMVPTLGYEQGGHRIAIRRASSMVADLAPLAMWVERIVEPGDLLIIDEPESHLHPQAIRLVARVLVRLVGEGVSVVCATHSPVLIHELSNCLLLGQQRDHAAPDPESGYEASDRLNLDDIAVHRFHRPDPGGSVEVTNVKIESDWGIPEDEYVDVASEQSDATSRLIDSLL